MKKLEERRVLGFTYFVDPEDPHNLSGGKEFFVFLAVLLGAGLLIHFL